MDKTSYQSWSTTRKKGKINYILNNGIKQIPLAIIVSVICTVSARGLQNLFSYLFLIEFFVQLIIILIVFITLGIIFGAFQWRSKEKKFSKYKEQNNL